MKKTFQNSLQERLPTRSVCKCQGFALFWSDLYPAEKMIAADNFNLVIKRESGQENLKSVHNGEGHEGSICEERGQGREELLVKGRDGRICSRIP